MREAGSVREARRAEIVAAARELVAEGGLEALTFAALERALGYTRGVVTWHFRNKDDVVQAVLADAIAEIDRLALAAIRSEATLSDRARAVVREMVGGWLGERRAGRVLVWFWGRMPTDPEARAANAALFARYRSYSADLVRIGQRRGEFDPEVDADAAAAVIVALVVGIASQALFDDMVDVESAVAAAGEAVVRYLAGAR